MKQIAKGKGQIVRVETDTNVSSESLELWRKRGFKPQDKGIAVVTYLPKPKEYSYPLMWEISDENKKATFR